MKRMENFLAAKNITQDARKRAMLLHYAGETVFDIFCTLPETGDNNDYQTAVIKLNEYFSPQKNVEFEVFTFRQARQDPHETVDQFHTRLQKLAVNCEFADKDREVKSQIIQGCASIKLKTKALQEATLNLGGLLVLARSMAASETQARSMESSYKTEISNVTDSVNAMRIGTKPKQLKKFDKSKSSALITSTGNSCRNCGDLWPHTGGPDSCKAKGRRCNYCGVLNHFECCCRKKHKNAGNGNNNGKRNFNYNKKNFQFNDKTDHKQAKVNTIHNLDLQPQRNCIISENSDEECVYSIHERKKILPVCTLKIEDKLVNFIIDSGSTVNILERSEFKKLNCKQSLKKSSVKIFTYGSSKPLAVDGAVTLVVESANKLYSVEFQVTSLTGGSLLGFDTASELGLIKVIQSINTDSCIPEDVDKIALKYPNIFKGIGKLKGCQVKLHVNPNFKPIAQKHRRIPFHMRKKVDKELNKLLEQDIIEKVTGPTPWVSPIVVVPKPNQSDEVRICVDMRQANQAITRERHITPTIDDVITELNGSTVFSKLDLNKGFHQLELDNESRSITTFSTHRGLFQYKRLSFGISSAPELFQQVLRQLMQGVKGIVNISDDILVHGENTELHDEALENALRVLDNNGLTLNKHKCEFRKDSVEFYGHKFSKNGVQISDRKISTITQAKKPQNATEVRSFMGMANFCGKFISNLATISRPLLDLTHKDVLWNWTTECQTAFDTIKLKIAEAPTLTYFQPTKETLLYVDASPVGLGAILAQKCKSGDSKPVLISSRALTSIEQRYSQIEREALAITWAIHHFHLYLFGSNFVVVTDHKPLESLFNRPLSTLSARLERWRLSVQAYTFTVKYEKGSENPADFMSRHPTTVPVPTKNCLSAFAEDYVNSISISTVPIAFTLDMMKQHTKEDSTLREVIRRIKSGKWHDPIPDGVNSEEIISFKKIHKELAVTNDRELILKNRKIVVPRLLRQQAIELAHEGHQGVVKTKALMREKVWFPNIDKAIETHIKNCIPCAATVSDQKRHNPVQMTKLPSQPWTHLSIDICGPFPSGEFLLVTIDDHSRFPEVDIIRTTSSACVILKLERIFSSFGIPIEIRTDNGSCFTSMEFRNFTQRLGISHRRVTPYWPQANGEVERFMRTIKKAIQAAHIEKKNWKEEIIRFLSNYRATPHTSTGKPPGEILFGRPFHIKFPEIEKRKKISVISLKDEQSKNIMKENAEKRRKTFKKINVGDRVLVQQEKQNKLTSLYDPAPYVVSKVKGTMITAVRGTGEVTRNISLFQLLPKMTTKDQELGIKITPDQEPFTRPVRLKKSVNRYIQEC